MGGPPGYGKRAVSRAGSRLASRLEAVRRGDRPSLVDEADPDDVHAREVVEWWQSTHLEPMFVVSDHVAALTPPLDLGEEGAAVAVSSRPKRFEAMIEKLTREPVKLADMVDVGGVRAVVTTQDESDELAARLTDVLDVRRVRDWAHGPRPTGYRAVHLHVRQEARLVEVQVRTFGQDLWANLVEEESRLSGINYKGGRGDPAVLRVFFLLADLLAAVELGESHPDLAVQLSAAYKEAAPLLRTPILRDLEQ